MQQINIGLMMQFTFAYMCGWREGKRDLGSREI